MKKLVLICGILGLFLGFTSCASGSHINFTKCDVWEDVADNRGEFKVKNDGVTELIMHNKSHYVIKGVLRSNGKSREVRLCVDTGAKQNLITPSIINFFDGAEDSGYNFILNAAYAQMPQNNSKGYYFESFEAAGFEVKDMLFQDFCIDEFELTADGEVIDGIIGMDIFRRAPFKFSIIDMQLVFYDDSNSFPKGNAVPLVKKDLPYRLSAKFKLQNGKEYKAFLDTGARTSYVSPKKINSMKKYLSCVVELKHPIHSENFALLNNVDFCGETIPLLPIQSNVQKKGMTFGSNITLGSLAFRNLDLYVDVQNAKMVAVRRDCDFPKITLSDILTGGTYIMMGATISDSREKNVIAYADAGKYFITMVSYVDGVPTYPNIKLEDEVLEVNGIPVSAFDWDNWYDINEAELLLLRDGKEFTEKIYRHEFIFGPEF